MSFTWFADRPLRTREQVMEVIVQVADELDMPDKRGACIIAGMTVAQEAGSDDDDPDTVPEWWCPANPTNDPETLKYEHDSESNDSRSSGYYQQQPPWWGTAAQRMSLYESTKMFLTSLKRYQYRASNAQEANNWAQKVQGSSFPNAYAKWWQLANDVYDNVIRAKQGLPAPAPRAGYGLPTGTQITYGSAGFPDWVYQLAQRFNVRASTYPGHQETDRNEAGYAPNPAHLNRGIDWAGSVDDMQRLADYLFSIRGELEQLIWQNPGTGRRLGVAGGKDVTTTPYYDYPGGYDDHRDHVHTRQDHPIPVPGGTPAPVPAPAAQVGWKGDPVWLPDVLRAAGLVCHIYPGAFDRGHGDMGDIWGVMCHHTGSFGETPHGIAEHPTLGLASQLYLSRDGEYTLCGVGIAWHAGNGSWPGLPANNANNRLIGIEAANDGGGTPGKPHRTGWSDAQYDAYTRGVAAILGRLGYGSDRCIGHKDWAGKAQGKWDPGAIDMNIFRADVAARLSNSPIVPTTPGDDFMSALSDADQRELLELVRWLAAPGTGELRKQFPSRSAVREPNEGVVDTAVGMELNTDGNVDFIATFLRAALKFPPAVERLQRVAAGAEPGRSELDSLLAQAMLADAPNLLATTVVASVVSKAADPVPAPEPQVVYVDRPVPAPAAAPEVPAADLTPGQVIGAAYDALQALQLSGVLDDAEKATLGALQGVLNQKLGASA